MPGDEGKFLLETEWHLRMQYCSTGLIKGAYPRSTHSHRRRNALGNKIAIHFALISGYGSPPTLNPIYRGTELGRVSATPLVPEILTFLQLLYTGAIPLTVRSRTNIGKGNTRSCLYTKYFPSSLVQSYPQRATKYTFPWGFQDYYGRGHLEFYIERTQSGKGKC